MKRRVTMRDVARGWVWSGLGVMTLGALAIMAWFGTAFVLVALGWSSDPAPRWFAPLWPALSGVAICAGGFFAIGGSCVRRVLEHFHTYE